MNNSGGLFFDQLTEWLLEAGFIQYKYQMSIYYNRAPYGTNIVVLYYVDYCLYWYTSDDIGKWHVDTLGKRLHVNLLGICTLVHVNNTFSDEGSSYFCGSD